MTMKYRYPDSLRELEEKPDPDTTPRTIRRQYPHAHIKSRYNCGCGYKTSSDVEASEHARSHGHILHISGEVVPVAA